MANCIILFTIRVTSVFITNFLLFLYISWKKSIHPTLIAKCSSDYAKNGSNSFLFSTLFQTKTVKKLYEACKARSGILFCLGTFFIIFINVSIRRWWSWLFIKFWFNELFSYFSVIIKYDLSFLSISSSFSRTLEIIS